MPLLKVSIDGVWRKAACPCVCIHGDIGVVPMMVHTWLTVWDSTLTQSSSAIRKPMKLESGAGILHVAIDGFLDAGAELGTHLGRSVHVDFKTSEGVDQRE